MIAPSKPGARRKANCILMSLKYSVNHPQDSKPWEVMSAIKQDILRKMDTFPGPVRVCCVKFLQRVVQVQTPGLISDPRVSSSSPPSFKAD